METIKHARLYWVSRSGTRFSAEIPTPYVIVMPHAVCPMCLDEERNCEIDTVDAENKVFTCRENGSAIGNTWQHVIPKRALRVSGAGNSLVRVLDPSMEYIGKERTDVG